jgi:hypothetical protein
MGWLLPFSFQFFNGLAAVFAEEVGCFGLLLSHDGPNLQLHGMILFTLTA